jgi:Zn-dependent protease with chaperone function
MAGGLTTSRLIGQRCHDHEKARYHPAMTDASDGPIAEHPRTDPDPAEPGKATKRRKLRPLPGLLATDFQHPSDIVATDALKKIPGLEKAMSKILEYGLERLYYVDNVASNLRVTPAMFGRLQRSLTWACKILDVAEPEMYVALNPVPNAFTYGHTKPFITVTSGLIDLMSDEELFFVIGHEVGHIKAGHVLYGTIARNIAAVMELVGQATLGIGALLGQGLVYALLEWYRCAELTCDRAALLCVQDLDSAQGTFMKLAGGNTRLAAEMDRGEFLRQIRAYEDVDRSALNKAYKILLTAPRTHPFAIQRAKELDVWHSDGYDAILRRYAPL